MAAQGDHAHRAVVKYAGPRQEWFSDNLGSCDSRGAMKVAGNIFDRQAVRRHRDRAASSFADHDFLFREMALRLTERLDDIKRSFPIALDLGARTGALAPQLAGRAGIERLVQADVSARMAAQALASAPEALPVSAVVADEA